MPLDGAPHAQTARWYDRAYEVTYGAIYTQLTNQTLELIREIHPPPASVVDFGAGTGRLALPLVQQGYDVTAVEPCREMLAVLDDKARDQGVDRKRLSTCPVSMQAYHAGGRTFDVAICVFTVVAYLLDEDALTGAFRSIHGALKPGGCLLIDVPRRVLYQQPVPSLDEHGFRRRVELKPVGDDLYAYAEELQVLDAAGQVQTYSERFLTRYWELDSLSQHLENVGFVLERDESNRFGGTGAAYLVFRAGE